MILKINQLINKHYRLVFQIVFILALVVNFHFGILIWALVTLLSLFFGGINCGFVCTWGIYQDWLNSLGKKMFKHKFNKIIPSAVHEILKYFRFITLAAWTFFATAYLTTNIIGKIGSPNPSSLLNLLTNPKTIAIVIVIPLFIHSAACLLISRPYCKYFCSRSLWAGAWSYIKLVKIKRDPNKCINCGRCEKVCPMSVPITKLQTVSTDSCVSCYQCVKKGVCPKKGAIYLDYTNLHRVSGWLSKNKKPIPQRMS